MERDFKGIWIPREIWMNELIKGNEMILFVEIDSLSKTGECFASNEHFAKLLGISKDRVSKLITSLRRKGLISLELIYKPGKKEIEKRILKTIPLGENTYTPIGEETYTPSYTHLYPIGESAYTPIGENAYDNNTYINNTINNTTNNTSNNKKEKKKREKIPLKPLEEEFESLWKIYPRKHGDKKRAKNAYIKAIKNGSATYEMVKHGIEMYVKYNEYHNVQEEFIKHGATWFYQECWNNDFTCTPKLIKGKRNGFAGLLLNERDMQRTNIIDYEESIIDEKERNPIPTGKTTNAISYGL